MRYALIREMDISNGIGVGVSLFVQGCHFHCEGCFNEETWDFCGGHEWTKEVEERFFDLINRPYIKRVSILGGEPLAPENLPGVLLLLAKIKTKFPDKTIWLYTGYKWETIQKEEIRYATALCADVVVDGQFDLSKQDLLNEKIVFAGSTNQRIINTRETLKAKEVVELII